MCPLEMQHPQPAPVHGAPVLRPSPGGRRLRSRHMETHMVQPCQGGLGTGAGHLLHCQPCCAGCPTPCQSQQLAVLSHPAAPQVSKATTLQKTAEYICKLQQERAALQDEAQRLREQIEELNGSIK